MGNTVILGYDQFAALMCMDSNHSMEPFPETFRCQPTLELVLPFSEYQKFLTSVPSGMPMLFRSPADALKSPLKSYYGDMTMAVCKEIYFAEKFHSGCTVIRHQFDVVSGNCPSFDPRDFSAPLQTVLEKRNYPVPYISQRNKAQWDYACLLFACCIKDVGVVWNFS